MPFDFDESKVTYTLEPLHEHTQVKGNAIASGNDDYDKEVEDSIVADLEGGNEWAWCTVKVLAQYDGIDCVIGSDYLGCCSYASREDFLKDDGYYESMKDVARADLYNQLLTIYNTLSED